MSNPFVLNPLKVVVYDPIKNTNMRTYVFLGNVPKNIQHAVRQYEGKKIQNDLLRSFYGDDFAAKLCLNVKSPSDLYIDWREVVGSADELDMRVALKSIHDNDDYNEDDIEQLLRDEPAPVKRKKDHITHLTFTPGVEYVSGIDIYPEDKYSEVKEKIYMATDIPIYRQHLFYINRDRTVVTYKLWADGFYKIDIRELNLFESEIGGMPIDKFIYDVRSSVRVEALDTFMLLEMSASINHVIYITDLSRFTANLQNQVGSFINDTYQFELLYYGFIIVYWPQLTKECFYDYMVNEGELQYKYPDLAKSKQDLMQIYSIESEIVNFNYQNETRAMAWAESIGTTVAITQMIAVIENQRTQLNIRNMFERLRATRCIPEIHAYTENNGKKYLLRKRYIKLASDIQFPSGALMKNGITMAILLQREEVKKGEIPHYIFLNIWPNGKYYVKTTWDEEDELNFEDIIKILKKFIDPIITGINNLGRYVFIAGERLALINRNNISYQGMNICIFWKRIMLESTFKIIKSLWDIYIRARIIAIRAGQQYDKYEFLFRKGMYEFDMNAIEKIVNASNNIVLNNYYAYMSNNTIKQKWDQNYEGRIVKMQHRTTSVKFEVSNIHESEFLIFQTYIVLFMYKASLNEKVRASMSGFTQNKEVKKLRKLKEEDPELFNLKKHGSKKVYSILCQNQRQPLVYTQDELRAMSAAEVKKVTTYWNFTLNKPAYYGCPNSKYPHLSFTIDAHPKHYCLPCCSKATFGEESKKNRVLSVCLSKHTHPSNDDEDDSGISRHITNYGRDIELGRLCKLPNTTINSLMYNTLRQPKTNYYVYGVAQHVPAVNNIGIVFAVAEALNISPKKLMKQLIEELRVTVKTNLFYVLINGMLIEYFDNMEDLIVSIKELFVDYKMIGREKQSFKQYPELFIELFHILFKISIFTFVDSAGDGSNVSLYVQNVIRNEISYVNKLSEQNDNKYISDLLADQKYVVLIKKINNYYPIFLIDSEVYFRTYEVHTRYYTYDSELIRLIHNMVLYEDRNKLVKVGQNIDLSLLKEVIDKMPAYKIAVKYINKQNLCYAALVGRDNKYIYVPVDYSIYLSDNTEITFEAFEREKYDLDHTAVTEFVDSINKYIRANYSMPGGEHAYNLIKYDRPVAFDGRVIGFTSNGVIWYTNGGGGALATAASSQPVSVKYDYSVVNRAILKRTPPVADRRTELIGEALYNNYLYQLFLIEFIHYLDKERNTEIRKKLIDLINGTNFKKHMDTFKKEFDKILRDFPNDSKIIQDDIIKYYYFHFNKQLLIDKINSSIYEFDRMTINKLQKMDNAEIIQCLGDIARTFSIEKEFDTKNIKFPNIYLPCVDMQEETGYCVNKKLMINKNIDQYISILASDIVDDLKSKYFINSLFSDNVMDYLRFTQNPLEIINIYRLSE